MNDAERLIHARRSNIFIADDAPIDTDIVDRMILAAQAAPNHKLTRPLRVCVVSGASRASLGNTIAEVMAARNEDAAKVAKTRTKYMRAPVVLVVASALGDTSTETEENRYAVAAGIQNMLLVATNEGLATLWGSPAKGANDAITDFCGFENTDLVIGLVYVGQPERDPAPTERSAPYVTRRS